MVPGVVDGMVPRVGDSALEITDVLKSLKDEVAASRGILVDTVDVLVSSVDSNLPGTII